MPTNDKDAVLALAQAPITQQEADRRHQLQEAFKAYKGAFPAPLKIEKDQPNDNVISNRCSPIVDKGTSFLFGQQLKIECDDQDECDGLWGDPDDCMALLSDMAINGGITGTNFVKIIPTKGSMKYPRIVVMDPQVVRIVTAPDDCDLVLAYVIEYPMLNDWQKRQVIARVDPDGLAGEAGEYDLDDTWTICTYLRKGNLSNWQKVGEEDWPYPFAPIFHCKNLPNPNEPYGRPDLTPDLIEQNKVLNFVLSNISRIIKYHGHPVTIAIATRAAQMEVSVDGVICLPDKESDIKKLAPMDNFNGLLAFVANIMANMDEQSRVPAVALGRLAELPKGNISGVALQLLFQPLIEVTLQKQRTYGKLIRQVTRAGLVIMGKLAVEAMEDYEVTLHWENLLPVDDLAAAQTAQILQAIGVSQTTLLEKLGFDADAETEKVGKEQAKSLSNFAHGTGFPPAQSPQLPAQNTMPGQQSAQPAQPGQGGTQAT